MGLFTERDEETPNQIILGKLNRIEAKLDALIKALHDYDGNDEYGESSFEAFQLTNDYISSLVGPCVGHDKASWDAEEAERRMDIIGQNGNEGLHYGIEGDNDIQDKHTVVEKKRNNGRESGLKAMNEGQPKQKQYYKNKRSKRSENKK
jgi:hypothetical protein